MSQRPPIISAVIPCPECGHPNLPGVAFCDECGHDLTSAGQLSAATPAGVASTTVPEPAASAPLTVSDPFGDPFADVPVTQVTPASTPAMSAEPDAEPPRDVVTPAAIPQAVPVAAPSVVPSATSAPTAATLSVERNGTAGVNFPVTPGALIGKWDMDAGIFPEIDTSKEDPDGYISRRHATLDFHHGHWVITDLGSTNGTAVNRQKLAAHQPHALNNGDEVIVGRLFLRFRALAGP